MEEKGGNLGICTVGRNSSGHSRGVRPVLFRPLSGERIKRWVGDAAKIAWGASDPDGNEGCYSQKQ